MIPLPEKPSRVVIAGAATSGRTTLLMHVAAREACRGRKVTFFGHTHWRDQTPLLKRYKVTVDSSGQNLHFLLRQVQEATSGEVFVVDDLNTRRHESHKLDLAGMRELRSAIIECKGWMIAAVLCQRSRDPWSCFFDEHWVMENRIAIHTTGMTVPIPRFGGALSAWRRLDNRLGYGCA